MLYLMRNATVASRKNEGKQRVVVNNNLDYELGCYHSVIERDWGVTT